MGVSGFKPACDQTVMICSLPRSGSNLLCELLESTRKLGNPDEWLNQDRQHWNRVHFGLPESATIEDMIRKLQEETRTFNGVFSHKILMYSYPWLVDSLRAVPGNGDSTDGELLRAYFPGLKLIYTRREDTLSQAISLLKASQSAIWHHNARTADQSDPVHFLWTEIDALIKDLKKQEQAWERFFEESGIPCMPVLYEDLVRDKRAVTRDVMRFLGLEAEEWEKGFTEPRHRRTSDATNKQWRQRYLDLAGKVSRELGRDNLKRKLRHAVIEIDPGTLEVESGRAFSLKVRVRNTSPTTWRDCGLEDGRGWIKLAAQVLDEQGQVLSGSGSWRELPRELEPGESIEITLTEKAPGHPGTYSVWVDLVVTPGSWFHESCGCGKAIPLIVNADEKQRFLSRYFGSYEERLDGAIYHVDWFGEFHLNNFPDLYHFGLGPLKCHGPGSDGNEFRFESPHHGVLVCEPDKFPVLWSEKHGACLKWHKGTHAPPRLSILKNDKWIPFNFKPPGKAMEDAIRFFGKEPDEQGILTLDWMGELDVSEYPKVKHEVLGTVWCSGPGAREDSFFFNNPKMGWFWTNSSSYPQLRNMQTKDWVDAASISASIF